MPTPTLTAPPRIGVRRLPVVLRPDTTRTVIRPFMPSDPTGFAIEDHPHGVHIVARVLAFDDAEVAANSVAYARHC